MSDIGTLVVSQTTYENLQSGGRPNVYDQGCLRLKVQASKHKFQAYIQEEVRAPPANRFGKVEKEPAGARCAEVEDDLGTGGDLAVQKWRMTWVLVVILQGSHFHFDMIMKTLILKGGAVARDSLCF